MAISEDYQVFEAGDVLLQSGVVFRSLRLAYQTYGTLNARKDNVIVYPTSFSAQHTDTEWLVQPGGILDPDRFFIVIPNLFGNGLSSSPSNSEVTPFPAISYHDAVAVQRRLLVEQFGISTIALVYGWSMGSMQAYHWAACHPDMVERAAIVCEGGLIAPEHLAIDLNPRPAQSATTDVRAVERQLIEQALRECRGNKSRAAIRLGLTRKELYGRLKQYRLE